MAKKKPKAKLRPDVAETAFRTLQEAIGEAPKTKPPGERSDEEKHPEAVKRGAKGGKKGGKARAKKLTDKERSDMASIAAQVRWRKSGN
jgi:hypothetical protein